MLTIHPLKSAENAATYYQKDNYYAKEGEVLQGNWIGKGAEQLNLGAKATLEQFKAILEGKLSEEIRLEAHNGGEHRCGYDLTFSAPKSVSILAVVTQDEGIINAHRTAVAGVFKHLQENYSLTRVKDKKKLSLEKTGNLIACTFEHNDSRLLDPNLHTHMVIMNAVLRADGNWCTLFADKIFEDKMILGMLYRSLLAQELMKLGFGIEQTSEKGTFEIQNFPPELIRIMSKRRKQIEAYMEEHGLEGAEGAKIANFNTRPNKKSIDPEHLTLAWTIDLASCGYSIEWLQKFCNEAKARGPITPPDPLALAEKAIKTAIYHLSSFQPVFRREDILKSASFLCLLNHSPTLLEQCLEQQLQSAELLYLGNQLCTTQAARDLEIENVASARLNKKQVHPLFTRLATKFVLYQSGLENAEHKEALAFLLRTPDRQVAIQYGAKANQQTLIRAYLDAIRSHRLYPVGLTQDPVRVEPFKETLGLERVHTIEGFLLSCASRLQEIQFQKANPGQVPEPQTISTKRSPHFGKIKTPSRPKSVAQLRDAREIWILDCESPVSLLQV
ncbi:MAG: relaxase domain-containing protein, partial [Oligoflexales bacterium]|nr:relaxase domain-containing protein [Oligoflexales bacterium]